MVNIPSEGLCNAVFLSHNTIFRNEGSVEYDRTWNDVELLPLVTEGAKVLTETDYALIVLVQAPQMGLGEISFEELDRILIALYGEFCFDNRPKGFQPLDYWYICPHAPDVECACRTPLPGLIFRAAVEMDICLSQSWFIGKNGGDIQAGINAGVGNLIYIMSEQEWKADSITFPIKCDTEGIEIPVCRNMLQAAQMICNEKENA